METSGVSIEMHVAPQWHHGILRTYISLESPCRVLSNAPHAKWVGAAVAKIHYKYLEKL
jgi:hypothetical protein